MKRNKKLILACALGLLAISIFLVIKGSAGNYPEEDASTQVVKNMEENPPRTVTESGAEATETSQTEDESRTQVNEEKQNEGKNEKEKETEKNSSLEKNSSDETDQTDSGNTSESQKKKETTGGSKTRAKSKKSQKSQSGDTEKNTVNNTQQSQEPVSATAVPTPAAEEEQNVCTLTITCQEVFSHMDKLSESAKKVIPADGMILQGSFGIQQGDTVFDVLKRACTEKNVMLDYVYTPVYSTYYIRGIHNLYEFDCGDESGWMYSVNGTAPGYGCSQYNVSKGDKIIFYYTCER